MPAFPPFIFLGNKVLPAEELSETTDMDMTTDGKWQYEQGCVADMSVVSASSA
ncbi:MAG: hypothetical protein NC318_01510 [Blautia sp.]|nr:hypothetical protein [Lachnoclostridium sp.]MCM1210258.1 hypothetical protein [Blautia sp.]